MTKKFKENLDFYISIGFPLFLLAIIFAYILGLI